MLFLVVTTYYETNNIQCTLRNAALLVKVKQTLTALKSSRLVRQIKAQTHNFIHVLYF